MAAAGLSNRAYMKDRATPKTAPMDVEHALIARGHTNIAGVDEVGRGAWAGPVVAAAVVLTRSSFVSPRGLNGVNDSKQLTAQQRDMLLPQIHAHAAAIGVGCVPAWLVDQIGILAATRLAMEQAVLSLSLVPDVVLIDALTLPAVPLLQHAIIRGDSGSISIAAASIVAKTSRDRYMRTLDRRYPHHFGAHKGYGTALHRWALDRYGPTALHRHSFHPICNMNWKGPTYGTNNRSGGT
ncbi:MAG: ribonuclease HII [Herpetosiphon sp.]